jgi:hypothetical protein
MWLCNAMYILHGYQHRSGSLEQSSSLVYIQRTLLHIIVASDE